MTEPVSPTVRPVERTRARQLDGPIVVTALVLLHGTVNWLWLRANTVTYGWDRMDHLVSSLAYNDVLRTLSLRSLFEALAWSNYYPPLVHLVAVAAYKLFGVSEDVAAMTNLVYLTLLLSSVWYLGWRFEGQRVALLATLMAATFPMFYAMSRYLYIDFALAGFVAASIAALVATDEFRRRRMSLLFGALLGLGFWVKWTMAAFLAGPLLVVLWRSGVVAQLIRRPALLRPAWRRLTVALIVGSLLAFGVLWPAREVVAQQLLGLWLLPLFALLVAGTVYGLLAPSRDPARNALSAGAVAALVIGLWYLTNIEFLVGFYVNAYGKPSGRRWAYQDYLEYVVTEQLGPLYTVLFVMLAVRALYRWWREGASAQRLRSLDTLRLVLLTWVVVPFLVFGTRVSTVHSRYLMPFLPPFALWMAVELSRLKPPRWRAFSIALVMMLAWGQFLIISFDRFDPWRGRFLVSLPGVGQVNLLAHGFNIQYPTVGRTDPNFAIADDVLDVLEAKRQAAGRKVITLGLLVNTYQLHEKHFLYQIYVKYPRVHLRELARNWTGRPAYPQLFEMDFVLVSDRHTYRTSEESQAVVERILNNSDDLFNRAFRPVKQWVLPNGERIVLYERRFSDFEPGIAAETYHRLLQALGPEFGAGDALILSAPNQVYVMGQLLPPDTGATVVPWPPDGEPPEEATALLADLAATHRRIFLLDRYSRTVDPEGHLTRWLSQRLLPGPERWFDDVRVQLFVPGAPARSPTRQVAATFEGSGITLVGVAVGAERIPAGGAVPVTLFWKVPENPKGVKVFVHLYGPDGTLLAQHDLLLDRNVLTAVLPVPRAIAPGIYRLVVGVYDAKTGHRFPLSDGRDAVEVGTVVVVEQ